MTSNVKGKGKPKKKKINTPRESSEEEEYYTLLCVETYSGSRTGESWIQCQEDCKQWPHVPSTFGSRYYIVITVMNLIKYRERIFCLNSDSVDKFCSTIG